MNESVAIRGFIPSLKLNAFTNLCRRLLCLFSCLMMPSRPLPVLLCSYAYARSTDHQIRPMQGSLTERWVALYHHALPPASTSDWPPTSFLLAFRAYIYYTSSDTRAVFSGLSRSDVVSSPFHLHRHIDIHSFYPKEHIQGNLVSLALSR